jgi:hypothetical protein
MFGSIAKALLCATLGQSPGGPSPGEVMFTSSRAQKMEATVPDARRAEIRELLLYASHDQGENWSQVSKITSEQREFQFNLPVDGLYWLCVAVVTRDGRQEPQSLAKVQPNWKLVVDTLKPLARITSAVRTGNEVAVAWEAREDHPEWSTFRLEYQTSPGGLLAPINAAPGLTGQTKFNPSTNGAVVVKLTLRDKAGNETVATAEVTGFGADVPPQVASAPPIAPSELMSPTAAPLLPPTTPTNPVEPALPHAIETMGASIPGNPGQKTYPASGRPKTLAPTQLMPVGGKNWTPNSAPATAANYQPPPPMERPIASTEFPVQPVQYQVPVPPPQPKPAKNLPDLQYVNSPEVVLEYELSKVGPSGVGSVDIYLTHDDGQSWDHVATDPAVIGLKNGGRHQGIVELPGDGVYGFSLVVKSNAQVKQEMTNLDKKPKGPRGGDAPEIRVEVDTRPPMAELFPPRRDAAKANSLMLVWTASDKNLGSNPVTLEWSERRDGQWFPIATNIPNSSKHSWQLPDRLPVQVFMRLRVRDLAGNEGVAVTPDPLIVDLNEPEGRLLNVSVAPRR